MNPEKSEPQGPSESRMNAATQALRTEPSNPPFVYQHHAFHMEWKPVEQVIFVAFTGTYDQESAMSFREAYHALVQSMPETEVFDFLVDASQMQTITIDSRKTSIETAKHPQFRRMALWGLNTVLRAALAFIMMAVGKRDEVRICKNREDALQWLETKRSV